MHWLDGISLDDNLISGRPSGSQGEQSDGNQRKSTQNSSPTRASRLQYTQTLKHAQTHTLTHYPYRHSLERELLERLYLAWINGFALEVCKRSRMSIEYWQMQRCQHNLNYSRPNTWL